MKQFMLLIGFFAVSMNVGASALSREFETEEGAVYTDDLEDLKRRGFDAINGLLTDRARLLGDRDKLLEECRFLRNRLESFNGDVEAQRLHQMLKKLECVLMSPDGEDLIASAEGAIKELNRIRREKIMLQQQLMQQIADSKKSRGTVLKVLGGLTIVALAVGLGVMIYKFYGKEKDIEEAREALDERDARILELEAHGEIDVEPNEALMNRLGEEREAERGRHAELVDVLEAQLEGREVEVGRLRLALGPLVDLEEERDRQIEQVRALEAQLEETATELGRERAVVARLGEEQTAERDRLEAQLRDGAADLARERAAVVRLGEVENERDRQVELVRGLETQLGERNTELGRARAVVAQLGGEPEGFGLAELLERENEALKFAQEQVGLAQGLRERVSQELGGVDQEFGGVNQEFRGNVGRGFVKRIGDWFSRK